MLKYTTFVCLCRDIPEWARASSFTRFLDHSQRRTRVGRTHLDKRSARRKNSSGQVISSSQRPLPDITQQSQQTNIHAPGRIRTHNLSRRAAADLCLRPRGHWDLPKSVTHTVYISKCLTNIYVNYPSLKI